MAKRASIAKYRLKLFYNFFLLFIAFAVTIGFFQFEREKEYRKKRLENQLITYNNLFSRYYEKNRVAIESDYHLFDSLTKLIPDQHIRITFIDGTGKVLYDSYVRNVDSLENHIKRPEIQQALVEVNGNSIRRSKSTRQDFFYCASSYNGYFVRSALPFTIEVANFLKADIIFIYVLVFIFALTIFVLIYLSDRFGKSISQLQHFASKAANDEVVDINEHFPKNELGVIGEQIVEVYNRLQKAKNELTAEREKLFRHLQISHEGIAVFAKDKSLLLANNHFIQYLNTLSDETAITPAQFFQIPELQPTTDFINDQIGKTKNSDGLSDLLSNILTINKNGKFYVIQAIVFHDNSFEISISDAHQAGEREEAETTDDQQYCP